MPDQNKNNNNIFLQELRAGDCPGVEKLEAYRLQPQVETATGAHLKGCAACQSELALLREFQAPHPETAQETADVDWIVDQVKVRRAAAAPVKAGWWQRLFGGSPAFGGLAAVAAALLVAAGLQYQMQQRTVEVPKEIGEGAVRASSVEIIIPAAGDVDAAPSRVEWKPVAGAASYEVALIEVDGNVLWTAQANSALSLDLAPAKGLFLPRKTLGLQVRAKNASGKVIAESAQARIWVMR